MVLALTLLLALTGSWRQVMPTLAASLFSDAPAPASAPVPNALNEIFLKNVARPSVEPLEEEALLTSAGDTEWLRQFGGFASGTFNVGRAVDADGNVYVAGGLLGADREINDRREKPQMAEQEPGS
ncbi:MAG TPA: hypothetical protein VGL29_13295 [Blastocatellia bacterium]